MRAEMFPRDVIRFTRGLPFTPLAAFEQIGGPRFLEFLPASTRPLPGPAGSNAAEGASAPASSAVDLLDD